MEPEACFDIIERAQVEGGQNSLVKQKLRVADGEGGREQNVLVKRTSLTEVAALEAANRVPGATAFPPLIRSGHDSRGHWIAIPFYPGQPPATERDIPENVAESLAAMHAHYLDSGPPEWTTVIDAEWWRRACDQQKVQRFADSGRPALQPIVDRIRGWSDQPVVIDTLATQPRTLLHGDVHRNNVVVTGDSGRLVDWESGLYGMPQLDLITLGGPGSPGYERYAAIWRALTGQDTAAPEWRRGWLVATVCVQLKYLPRGARVSGDDHAQHMLDTAARALAELEGMSSWIRSKS
jgi:hypothetical protein